MKRILIQDKSLTPDAVDSLGDLVQEDFKGTLEIEAVQCLGDARSDVTLYNLIISHPHLVPPFGDCCRSQIMKAHEKGIPIIFTYKVVWEEAEQLQAMSDDLAVPLFRRRELGYEFYTDLIRHLEGDF